MYKAGLKVPQNHSLANSYLHKAAEQGQIEAQYTLAKMYLSGDGVLANYAQAAFWMNAAAERGYPDAQLDLGALYADGVGVPQNYEAAYLWLSIGIAGQTAISRDTYTAALNEVAEKLTPLQLAATKSRLLDWFSTHSSQNAVESS